VSKVSVDKSLKSLGIDAARALRILRVALAKIERDRERKRKAYTPKRLQGIEPAMRY
jgi:hypothetical protein